MNLQPDSQVLIQGIAEPIGAIATAKMQAYGTKIVAGVSSSQGGTKINDVPVYDLVEQAVAANGAIDTTIIFVPPYQVLDAALEAIASGIRQIVIVTAGVPPLDMVRLFRLAETTDTLIVGPGSTGIIVPGSFLLGTHLPEVYTPGNVGVISRADTLTYEVAQELTRAGIGQSLSVNLGKDVIFGSDFRQWLQILEEDDTTEAIAIVGQISCGLEIAAEYIVNNIDKPVVAYLAGLQAPVDRRLGDAHTMIAYYLSLPVNVGCTAQKQISLFREAKIPIAKQPSEIPELLKQVLKKTEG
ncbi:succinate--CoA ligase subunit alpha [Merismopedia glauca]|uniref:CoA-binding protein n=1 Tax=Merismopedia glauca CCAP 1448/3 TaxID=1296344 RepID=A0A2T1C2Q4_9CYAN|nr:CoA-binding protein [Merismopedia glauca]PSB02427.1 CoA-binding protein [Merismopedia glauca CCAP 1448/3]